MSTATANHERPTNTISLNQLRIASPCTADWDSMAGDDRTRFCGECRLNVYNISAMTERDARELIAKAEGRLCVRMYRRTDGTVLTQDCPVGLAKLRRKARAAWMKAAAAFALLTGGLALGRVAGDRDSTYQPGRDSITDLPGIRQVKQWLRPDPPMIMGRMVVGALPPPPPPPAIMGDIAEPLPPPPPAHAPAMMGEVEAVPNDFRPEMGGVRMPLPRSPQ